MDNWSQPPPENIYPHLNGLIHLKTGANFDPHLLNNFQNHQPPTKSWGAHYLYYAKGNEIGMVKT